ncbi:DUF4834 family protein [Hymenobacter yonginensis]|uniref:DUF4834 family protein n=1 Tax=Hymenobacter yonginensis TaxID=748197 RepID=A0ABY7PPB2_9BACT|nr:DUF4834 family protein [Hymenobacter yonginensis]WBO84504.1 DUF4834 family protein [Hymenobacter yonginensis]
MFIKILLIFLVLALVLRFVLPLLMRHLLVGFLQKQARRHGQQLGGAPFGGAAPPPSPGRDAPGQVHIDYVPPTPRRTKDKPTEFKGGEYVDFEEVK